MNIRERQNRPGSLARLIAQRWLYGRAKTVENWRLISILAVAVLLLLGLAVDAELYSQVATIIVVLLWFLDQAVLAPLVDGRKEEAAAIQEDFDCLVLNLPWPEHSGVERPTDDRVKELTRIGGRGRGPAGVDGLVWPRRNPGGADRGAATLPESQLPVGPTVAQGVDLFRQVCRGRVCDRRPHCSGGGRSVGAQSGSCDCGGTQARRVVDDGAEDSIGRKEAHG